MTVAVCLSFPGALERDRKRRKKGSLAVNQPDAVFPKRQSSSPYRTHLRTLALDGINIVNRAASITEISTSPFLFPALCKHGLPRSNQCTATELRCIVDTILASACTNDLRFVSHQCWAPDCYVGHSCAFKLSFRRSRLRVFLVVVFEPLLVGLLVIFVLRFAVFARGLGVRFAAGLDFGVVIRQSRIGQFHVQRIGAVRQESLLTFVVSQSLFLHRVAEDLDEAVVVIVVVKVLLELFHVGIVLLVELGTDVTGSVGHVRRVTCPRPACQYFLRLFLAGSRQRFLIFTQKG